MISADLLRLIMSALARLEHAVQSLRFLGCTPKD
jgi:hypothetical protein